MRNYARIIFVVALGLLAACSGTETVAVIIQTEMGDIKLELYPEKAPITVANFLRYVDEGGFENTGFYRTVVKENQSQDDDMIFVLQGGRSEGDSTFLFSPIDHESTEVTGISHLDGVISMARNEPGTASSEFFICIGDNSTLDYGRRQPDTAGYATFGKVVRGMDVVHKIHQSPMEEQALTPNIRIINIVRVK